MRRSTSSDQVRGIPPDRCAGFLDGHRAALSNPCFNSRVNDSNWISSDGLSGFRSISRTIALPTTTASTCLPSSATAPAWKCRSPPPAADRSPRAWPAISGQRPPKAIRARPSRPCATPGKRNRVEYSATSFSRRSVTGRRGQEHRVEPVPRASLSTYAAPLPPGVREQAAVDAGRCRIARQALQPVAQHRVQISEQQQRNLRAPANLAPRFPAPSPAWSPPSAPARRRAGSPAHRRSDPKTARPARSDPRPRAPAPPPAPGCARATDRPP